MVIKEDIAPEEDVMIPEDIAPEEDVVIPEDIAPEEDIGGMVDAGVEPDTMDPDVGEPDILPAFLLIDNQTLPKPFNMVIVQFAALPADATQAGTLRIRHQGGDNDGVVVGTQLLAVGTDYEDLEVELAGPVLATQTFVADILDGQGVPHPDVDGSPLEVSFSVVGDNEDPELVVNSQDMDPGDLYGLEIAHVYVPERFPVGVWVAIYEDADGALGALRGKQKFMPGEHTDTPLALDTKLIKGYQMHAVMREPVPGSGSWKSSNPIVKTLSGQDMTTQFFADSEAFHPVLEIEDQKLTDPEELLIKKVTIPKEFFYGWVAIYADDNGEPGALIGKLSYTTGTKLDKTLSLTVPQEGEKTLHAILHEGQKWEDAKDVIMVAPGGGEMTLTFKVGADSLSYILAPANTTDNPRHVVVHRAYSWDKPAWVVLARDDNGQPGTIIATKKVLKKFAGNVHFTTNTLDFEAEGSAVEYLKGDPGTFRRCARGEDKLHVLLYEDDPPDSEFTYTAGGTEDLPVLDSSQKQVTAILDVTVVASIQNVQKDSPRYYWPCPLSQYIGNPTTLPVDCRCHANLVSLDFPECKREIADYLGLEFGEGPRAESQNFGHWIAGFSEPATNELIGLIEWKDHETQWPQNDTYINVGAVAAIDAETRKRRLIGGRFKYPELGIQDIGTGPVLSYPFGVQKGSDGKYYVASYAYGKIGASLIPTVDIIRMDPETGDREYVWRSNHLGFNFDNEVNPYGHCGNGRTEKFGYWSVQIGRKGFGMDADGNFYLSYAHNGNTPTSDGIGILKINPAGTSCDFVTRTKVGVNNVLYAGETIGAGIEPQAGPYKGMLVKDGKLFVSTQLDDDLWEIDIATGDRKLLHAHGIDDFNSGSSGTNVMWDPYRNLIWQSGLASSTLLYDPATDTSEPLWCPQNYRDYKGISCLKKSAWGYNGLLLERGIWMHPTKKDYVFAVNGPMVQRVDLKAGTSEIFSF